MSQSAAIVDARYTAARERPPAGVTGPWAWARRNLFGSWLSTAVTLLLGYLILRFAISFVSWAFVQRGLDRAVQCAGRRRHRVPASIAKGIGACWAIVADKYRLILFGRYPYRRAVAPGDLRRAVHRALRRLRHAALLAQGAGADLDRHAGGHRRADVGRRVRPAAGHRGFLGRPAAHADPGDLRPGLRISARQSWSRSGGAPPSCRRSRCSACSMSS